MSGEDMPGDSPGRQVQESTPVRALADPVVFVVGCGRSGSTLFRAMLDSNPMMAVPPETHIVPLLLREGVNGSGELDEDNFIRIAVNSGFLPTWELDEDSLRVLLADVATSDVAAAVRAMFQWYGDLKGKPLVGEKTPNYVREIALLSRTFPSARFIHLVRDPRDVALSFRRIGFESRLGVTATRWRRIMKRWDREIMNLESGRHLELRYEDLVTNPEKELAAVCEFLGLEYDAGMMGYHRRSDQVLTGVDDPSIHPRLAERPRLESSWTSELTSVEIAGIQLIAGDQFTRRGYEAAAVGRRATAALWAARAQFQWLSIQGTARLRRHRNGVLGGKE